MSNLSSPHSFFKIKMHQHQFSGKGRPSQQGVSKWMTRLLGPPQHKILAMLVFLHTTHTTSLSSVTEFDKIETIGQSMFTAVLFQFSLQPFSIFILFLICQLRVVIPISADSVFNCFDGKLRKLSEGDAVGALVSFYSPSTVTFPLSLRVSEILPLLFFSMPLFPYPTRIRAKI